MRRTIPMRRLGAAALGLAALAAAGCTIHLGEDGFSMHAWSVGDGPLRRGDGQAADEDRDVETFRAVDVRGGFELDLVAGEPHRLHLSGDSNLLAYVETRVEDGVLIVEMEHGRYHETLPLRLELATESLERLDVAGAIDGRLRALDEPRLTIEVAGAASLEADGRVGELTIEIAGSGHLELFELEARRVELEIAGSGSVKTTATERLAGEILGSGSVRYRGEPDTDLTIVGSGNIERER